MRAGTPFKYISYMYVMFSMVNRPDMSLKPYLALQSYYMQGWMVEVHLTISPSTRLGMTK